MQAGMQRNTIMFLVAYFICGTCLSQQYPFIQYTPKDGLVNNRARFMMQDSKGLLYIATYGGFSVYDGSRFTNYTMNDGLASNMIDDIVEMGEDSLWIIPNVSKIQCLSKGVIKNIITSDGFYPGIGQMIKCEDGSWYAAADEGLFKFEKNKFSKITLTDDEGKDAGRFFSGGVEIKNKLFITTDMGMQAIARPGRIVIYDLKKNKTAFTDPMSACCIVLSPGGDILVSTNKGIKKIDEASLDQNKINLVGLPTAYRAAEKLQATFLYFDKQKNLWIASGEGLARIDTTSQLKFFTVGNGLPVNILTSILQDGENTMWFTNDQTGISKLTNPHFEFYPEIKKGFFANDFYADNKTDSVWFFDAADKILLQYGKKSENFRLAQPLSNPPGRLFAKQGNKNYMTDLFNIYQCDFSAENKFRLTKLYADTTKNANLAFSCIRPDGYGNMIACSEKIIVIKSDKKIISYPLGYLADEFSLTDDKKLWVITRERKLFLFRIHPEDPDHYLEFVKMYAKELPEMSPRSIAADKNGNVWIGTRNHGLFCLFFDGTILRSWTQATTHEGLSDDFISYIHVDEENKIWTCSPAGLDQVQLKDGKIFIENITLSNNLYEHIIKIQTTKQGVHWVSTEGGVIKIEPATSITNHFHPKIIFTEIKEGTSKIDYTAGSSSLSYKKNNISFSLAAPSFIDEKQIRFSYLLEGSSNKTWSEPSPQSAINFVSLSPGKYTFRAKAMFVNHHYADSEIFYSFIINPPWWQTWWFRLLFAFLSTIILMAIIRNYYQRKFQQRQMVLEKQQAVEIERARIASDMHDDLGSGLSTIRFLSEKVKRNTFSDVTKGDIEKMELVSNELIDKMNEIIWSMNEKNDSLEQLIFYTRSYSMEYCENNNLACKIELPDNIPSFVVSGAMRRNVFLTVKESLHNIVKHANAKNVDIIITASESICISIKDDGTGLKENHKTNGGNGLRNMHKRIESIGGNMNIQNGNGILVILTVPLR